MVRPLPTVRPGLSAIRASNAYGATRHTLNPIAPQNLAKAQADKTFVQGSTSKVRAQAVIDQQLVVRSDGSIDRAASAQANWTRIKDLWRAYEDVGPLGGIGLAAIMPALALATVKHGLDFGLHSVLARIRS